MQTESRGTLLEDERFESVIHHLVGYHNEDGVLSVYLDIDPATAQREGFEAELLDVWKPLLARPYDQWTRGRLEYEIAGVTDAVRAWHEPPGRAVAMFFSGPGGLRTVVPLQFSMRSVARFEPRPVLSPLIKALDDHRRYCLVVFDKEHARIITIFLGHMEEEMMLHSDIIGRSAVGGWSQANYARHREHQVHDHARRTVEHLWAIDRSRPIHSLILSGPPEALEALTRQLPSALERSVVATLHIEMFAVTPDIVKLVSSVEASAREREDRDMVAELITETEKGGRATLGWDDTLQALGEGRVHLLVLPAGASRPGVQCPESHFLATSDLKFCPLCGEALWQSDDIIENAVRTAMLTDAHVHFLAPGASKLLETRGPAAVLRY